MWNKFQDVKPNNQQYILITDGELFGLAQYFCHNDMETFSPCGIAGYEWEWEFDAIYWSEINIALPE